MVVPWLGWPTCPRGLISAGGIRMQGDVRFAVLGPVRAWRDETELDLGQPKQRAALLVREGAQVTLEDLIDGVWGDAAPATAPQVIRSYIYQLRLVLGRDGTGHIKSAAGGYALQAGPRLDLARFAGLAAAELVRLKLKALA
jgi:DNA-binding SARP family transcriptional activator